MWSLSSWLKGRDEAVVDMQEPLLTSDGAGSYSPPSLPAHCMDTQTSHALSEQLPVSDRLPIRTQPSGHLISFSCPATPDTSSSGRGKPSNRMQGVPSTKLQSAYQQASPQLAGKRGSLDRSRASSSARLTAAAQITAESDSEDELKHMGSTYNRASHGGDGYAGRQPSWIGALVHEPPGRRSSLERQLSHDHSGYCQRCRSGSLDRRPSRELIGARQSSRRTQDSLAGLLGQHPSLTKDQLVTLPPSPFSILHHSQQPLPRTPSSCDEELAYDGALKRLSSTPRESASAANSRRSSMLSRIGSNQAASPDQPGEGLHSMLPGSYSWVPVMHADAQGAAAIPSMLHSASLQWARDAVKLWHGALKWVALWLTLSILTLLHAFGLVHSMANVSLAKVCAGLFCWTGVLGLIGSTKGLISECLAQQRSDVIAAANALGLKSVSVIAFMSAVLSCLACLVHAFVLNLLCQQNSHLPPCDPSIPLCVETYNLLLVLMVATMTMYGAHSIVSAVVAHRAHSARQILRNGGILQT